MSCHVSLWHTLTDETTTMYFTSSLQRRISNVSAIVSCVPLEFRVHCFIYSKERDAAIYNIKQK